MTPAVAVSIEPMPLSGPLFNGAVAAYAAAFADPPYNDPSRGGEVRKRLLDHHASRPGYRALVAIREDRSVAGMAYGYHGSPGQWWHDAVVQVLDRDRASKWLGDSYELVEAAVAPAHQGGGIGRTLIGALLESRPEATCVLSTRTDSRAHELYRQLGFEVLTAMRFAAGGARFYIMGKRLV